ncbi:hypothetical protein RND81_04G219000 [Saponaria officinalis]|uniref:GATA-type domain-containing protein n=1 Tax=Saponaria officinalis TaxID=3572 RepID=A0AAW1LM76_SAPOF
MNEVKKFCEDCRTTRTPLWRSGPNGPRSLCNACGIKYRKRKAANNRRNLEITSLSTSDGHCHNQIDPTSNMGYYNEYDRQILIQTPISSSSSSSSQVKKQRSIRHNDDVDNNRSREYNDVEEAAVLLMSLSCHFVFA